MSEIETPESVESIMEKQMMLLEIKHESERLKLEEKQLQEKLDYKKKVITVMLENISLTPKFLAEMDSIGALGMLKLVPDFNSALPATSTTEDVA